MGWLGRMLAGPVLWAVLFSAVYALHGLGCEWGWQARPTPLGPLHPLAMRLLWLAGLAGHLALILGNHGTDGRDVALIRAGNWIGFTSSLVTLFPLVATSSCAAG